MSISESAVVVDLNSQEQRNTEVKERERRSLAPTFDRLVDSNLKLTLAVGRLVNVTYLVLAATVSLSVISILHTVFRP